MRHPVFLVVLLSLALCGCDLFKNDGKLDLQLTDAPYTDAQRVVVTIKSIRLQPRDGHHESFTLDPEVQVDLLQLRNGVVRQLLGDEALPSGDYESIRLTLDGGSGNNYVQTLSGGTYPLDVPDDELDLDADYAIDSHGTTGLTLDVDLRRSLRAPDRSGDPYRLVPSLRLINNDDAGTISGTIRNSLIGSGCVAAMYIYQGKVTPDDVGGSGAQPYSSADVVIDGSGSYGYVAAFLPAGTYTLALTCQADEDEPDLNDAIDFVAVTHVDARAGHTETQNF
ncbi:DUF4382 domain-containing protein [Solimonas terrae]|uniref:DUF4382 domain-containing protein n=1 Tax=Solimonas terrae TaxID=1396819 RepID=A0A6M2BRT7_9GAMM|nr:DUF4382 domain-containing protein [Solimonas terrae]NGY05054.1 DUF4382 domain-containing protein [Solimonas terrae]